MMFFSMVMSMVGCLFVTDTTETQLSVKPQNRPLLDNVPVTSSHVASYSWFANSAKPSETGVLKTIRSILTRKLWDPVYPTME